MVRSMRSGLLAGAALVWGCGGGSTSNTPSPIANQWVRQVRSQIRLREDVLTTRGYELTTQIYTGRLRDDESETLVSELRFGNDYAFLGVCDNDCSDVDLRLFDDDGREVDSDVRTDDWPVVRVTPARSGRFRVRVIMASCRTNPCYYGVGLYRK